VTSDDKVVSDLTTLKGSEIVVTEKMYGQNTTLYRETMHARSLESSAHESMDWIKGFWGGIRYLIPDDIRICGEDVCYRHSISYENLPSYFLGFSAWRDEVCLSWDETIALFAEVGIHPAREIYRGTFDHEWFANYRFDEQHREGYVVRLTDSFERADFATSVAKYVRADHVTNAKHWKQDVLVKNGLAR